MKKQIHSAVVFICALGTLVFCGRDASAHTVTWTGGGMSLVLSAPRRGGTVLRLY